MNPGIILAAVALAGALFNAVLFPSNVVNWSGMSIAISFLSMVLGMALVTEFGSMGETDE